jgi:hypothetical protein
MSHKRLFLEGVVFTKKIVALLGRVFTNVLKVVAHFMKMPEQKKFYRVVYKLLHVFIQYVLS